MHQNFAGILNKQDILQIILHDFTEKNHSINVLCATETFLKPGDEKNLRLHNFKVVSYYSRSNERRVGVCILVKDNIPCTSIDLGEYSSYKNF